MCGISGYISKFKKIDATEFYNAHKILSHRGPDDEGFTIIKNNKFTNKYGPQSKSIRSQKESIINEKEQNFIIGHRRLSILDLSDKGHQPYIYKNYCITYNGEIYNFIELRKKLIKAGYKFVSNCDTEVFIKAFDKWGENAFKYFNGMWAAAIYDKKTNELIITRDRYGIKPIYYSYENNQFVFSSEIRFIRKISNLNDSNPSQIRKYINSGITDDNSETFIKNIFQLQPASYLKFKANKIETKKYYKLEFANTNKTFNLSSLLLESIKYRLRSDVKVGSLISGGVDSNSILGIIDKNKLLKKIKTFSSVYKNKIFSEYDLIRKIKKTNIEHEKIYDFQDCINFKSDIKNLIITQEEPFRSLSVLSSFKIYRKVSEDKNLKVILNGQGSDELFAGYEKYFYFFLLELLLKLKFMKFIKELFFFKNIRNISIIRLIKNLLKEISSIYIINTNKYGIFNSGYIKFKKFNFRKSILKQKLLESFVNSPLREFLRYEDKNSMHFSIETRVPFLDFNFVDMASKIPTELLIKNGVLKYVLKERTKELIPNEIYKNQKKYGFTTPQEKWQKTILKYEFDTTFEKIKNDGIFSFIDHKKVYKLYSQYSKNKFNDWTIIWRLYCLYKWKKIMKINHN